MSNNEWQDHLISKLNIQLKTQKENLNLQDQQLEKLIYILWKITSDITGVAGYTEHPKADAEQGRVQGNKAMWREAKADDLPRYSLDTQISELSTWVLPPWQLWKRTNMWGMKLDISGPKLGLSNLMIGCFITVASLISHDDFY